MKQYIFGVLLIAINAATLNAQSKEDVIRRSESLTTRIRANIEILDKVDRSKIIRMFDRIEALVDGTAPTPRQASTFEFLIAPGQIKFRDKTTDTHLYTWNNRKTEMLSPDGRVVAMDDTKGEFAAIRNVGNGQFLQIIDKWWDTIDYIAGNGFVAVLDKDGICTIYNSHLARTPLPKADQWKNTVQHSFNVNHVVLRDNEAEGNLEVFDSTGRIMKAEGVFEAYVNKGRKLSFKQAGKWNEFILP